MKQVNFADDGTVIGQGDESLVVRFYQHQEKNEMRSKEEGMNKYDNFEYVEILIPGCRDNCIRKASDQDKLRFRRQYQAFLNTKSDQAEGTPLGEFPFISPSERKELEYCNIYTGENLIDLKDTYIDSIPLDVRALIRKVKAFMEVAKDSAASVKYAAENEELKQQMALMQEQMKQILTIKSEEKADGNERIRRRGRQKVGVGADIEINTPH